MPRTARKTGSRSAPEYTAAPNVEVSADAQTITVFVSMTFRRIGGRKLIITPTGHDEWAPSKPRIDTPLLNAVVRAFHWMGLLERGEYATVRELAAAEHVNPSYLAHVLRLTQLAPDIVEAILDGRQPPTMQLQPLLRQGFPDEWGDQRSALARVFN